MLVMQFAPRASKVYRDMIWRPLVVLLLAIVVGSASLAAAPRSAGDITPALTEANKVIQKGGYAKAIEMIDEALRGGGGKVPPELAAKALLMRAESNEKLGRAAYAFADYNSAIWMQGLSAADRKRAEEGQDRVSKGLGVAAPKDGPTPAATASTPPAAGGQPAAQLAPANSVQDAPAAQRTGSTGGIGGFFNNLFGGSSSAQASPPPQEIPSTAVAVTAPPAEPAPPPKTGQNKAGQKKAAGRQPEPAPEPAPAKRPGPAAGAKQAAAAPGFVKPPETGNYVIQLAAVAEEDKAIAEADRLAKRHSADLGGRAPSLMIVPTADGGTLYKVVLGPYETRVEGIATCEMLKGKGLSCMVITKK
jgi:hypothetical protein